MEYSQRIKNVRKPNIRFITQTLNSLKYSQRAKGNYGQRTKGKQEYDILTTTKVQQLKLQIN